MQICCLVIFFYFFDVVAVPTFDFHGHLLKIGFLGLFWHACYFFFHAVRELKEFILSSNGLTGHHRSYTCRGQEARAAARILTRLFSTPISDQI